jgi:hypothetical protein
MIHEGFGPQLRVQVGDFSFPPSAVTLADLRARWSIYGGASSVTLFADRIEFDFPLLLPSDYQLAWNILRTVHDLAPKSFDDWRYDRIETTTGDHLQFPASIGVAPYFARYQRSEIEAAYADAKAIYEPALKFRFRSEDGSWETETLLEKSLLDAAAVFVLHNIKMFRVDASAPFEHKVMHAQTLVRRSMAALDLEYDHAGT